MTNITIQVDGEIREATEEEAAEILKQQEEAQAALGLTEEEIAAF
jgi:hypothetical protein